MLHHRSSRLSTTTAITTALALAAAISSFDTVRADVIYRETFGSSSSGRTTPNLYGWQAYDAAGTTFDTTGSGFGVDTAATLGRPGDVANVNAGPNSDGTTGALTGSRIFWNGAHRFAWTPEYVVN